MAVVFAEIPEIGCFDTMEATENDIHYLGNINHDEELTISDLTMSVKDLNDLGTSAGMCEASNSASPTNNLEPVMSILCIYSSADLVIRMTLPTIVAKKPCNVFIPVIKVP
ncbi:unnamed protein product [Orchesella dallaii]|uniref:Uncharacterized protein n=1 Tax=Orchesella dallaii TaxID=48710 RepID=A0ABP1RNY6_9HEXA